jgi:hypothetical protein
VKKRTIILLAAAITALPMPACATELVSDCNIISTTLMRNGRILQGYGNEFTDISYYAVQHYFSKEVLNGDLRDVNDAITLGMNTITILRRAVDIGCVAQADADIVINKGANTLDSMYRLRDVIRQRLTSLGG